MATQRRGRTRRGCVPANHFRCHVPARVPAVAGTNSGSTATLRGDGFTAAGVGRRPKWSDGTAAAAGDEDTPCRDGASCDAARRGTPAAVQIHTLKNGLHIERGGPCPSRRSDAERRRAPPFFRLATHALRPLKNGSLVLVGPTSMSGPPSGLKRHGALPISRPEISKKKFEIRHRMGEQCLPLRGKHDKHSTEPSTLTITDNRFAQNTKCFSKKWLWSLLEHC